VASPVAGKILEKTLTYLRVPETIDDRRWTKDDRGTTRE